MEPSRAVPAPRRPDPPRTESPDSAVELARLLRAAGYATESIQERLRTTDELLASSPELPSYLRRLGDGDELALLLRLFLLGVPVARARLEQLVGADLRARTGERSTSERVMGFRRSSSPRTRGTSSRRT